MFNFTKVPIIELIPTIGFIDTSVNFNIKINNNITCLCNNIRIEKPFADELSVFLDGKIDNLDFTLSTNINYHNKLSATDTIISVFNRSKRMDTILDISNNHIGAISWRLKSDTVSLVMNNYNYRYNSMIDTNILGKDISYDDFYLYKNKKNNIIINNDLVYNSLLRQFCTKQYAGIDSKTYIDNINFKKIKYREPIKDYYRNNYYHLNTYIGDIGSLLEEVNADDYFINVNGIMHAGNLVTEYCSKENTFSLKIFQNLFEDYKKYCYSNSITNTLPLSGEQTSAAIKSLYKNIFSKKMKKAGKITNKSLCDLQKSVYNEWCIVVNEYLKNSQLIS